MDALRNTLTRAHQPQEVNSTSARVLCRTENLASHHAGFNTLLRGPRILSVLKCVAAEPMLLFKEKINSTSSPAAAASRPTSTQRPTRTSEKSNTLPFSSPSMPQPCEMGPRNRQR
ncbi:hypothetical protein HO133_009022 [Letharia lupina]|uniref:Uncharacterized protein n=1 Tax=Letharia lupina TaxID=560253 RepID=A0A8H6CN52_9LECA|nr:uncharacterized protein HO133_009022 [Letharia lupina]KAF6226156.1 hypothetical protein HO133_009022 [Letharia lupina]